ncbi:MAG: hypothetical protein ABI411_07495 [Tahibacter sp.]
MPALMTRLRRRLVAVTWVFALLVLSKAVFATVCLTDGLADASAAAITISAVEASSAGHPLPPVGPDESDNCWHAGLGGCHCACVHVTALPTVEWALLPLQALTLSFPRRFAALPVSRRDDPLRPPIA